MSALCRSIPPCHLNGFLCIPSRQDTRHQSRPRSAKHLSNPTQPSNRHSGVTHLHPPQTAAQLVVYSACPLVPVLLLWSGLQRLELGGEHRTGSDSPFKAEVKGYTSSPPVLRPMRSVSSMKVSDSVPIWVRHRQNSGTNGTSSAGTGRRSRPACGLRQPGLSDDGLASLPNKIYLNRSVNLFVCPCCLTRTFPCASVPRPTRR